MSESTAKPMIEVTHLSKHFAGVVAVDDVSFSVGQGEIVGFLGPNGAGKTTTLRVLSGYLPASGGDVRVAGYDVFTQSRQVRAEIGYLPENCPLYPDMRVQEYLEYRARLKGVTRKNLRLAVAEAAGRCGLADVRNRIIGHLSKGFRQRVGLADAIVHKPRMLILDEPTVGLDPHQVLQVRDLIRDLGQSMTILLSTHQLPEVEASCHRVIIISGGRIAAADTMDGLRKRIGRGVRAVVEVHAAPGEVRAAFDGLPECLAGAMTHDQGWTTVEVLGDPEVDLRERIAAEVVRRGWRLRELRQVRRTLEDAFVELTRNDRVSGRVA
jgi:ABC-2 type transport system ATP-binding protein